MINSVRNTVLAVANKNNFGYITPEDFNLYAKQAQLDIFENYFYQYNQWVIKQNARVSGSEYANVVKHLEETLDRFSVVAPLIVDVDSIFDLPTDYYFINKIIYNNKKEVDKVSQGKVLNLLSSNLTAPSIIYPAYTMDGFQVTLYPTTIDTNVSIQYLRLPRDPKWTYTTIVNGSPLFDQSANDYQDFEIPGFDEVSLVSKILEYAGISIRESDLYNFGAAQEVNNKQIEG